MTNIFEFPEQKLKERIHARDTLSALVNSTGCDDEINLRMSKLIKAIDQHNYNVVKLELKK